MLASSDEQARLIEALLTLASSESGPSEHQPVDLSATVPAVLASREPETRQPGIRIDTVTEPATLDGDPLLVERLVANLVANAVRHNVADGRAEVRTGMSNGRAVLSVTNTGPLIPPAEVERLFQPFQRLDPRRASYPDGHGHGLGLSIVRAIAIAHHADITARPGPRRRPQRQRHVPATREPGRQRPPGQAVDGVTSAWRRGVLRRVRWQ